MAILADQSSNLQFLREPTISNLQKKNFTMRSAAQLDNQISSVVSLPEATASVRQNCPFPRNVVLKLCFETWVKTKPKEGRTRNKIPKYMHLYTCIVAALCFSDIVA